MARKARETELGIELQCGKCGEFFPADTEFFHRQADIKWGLRSCCKACYKEFPSVKRRIKEQQSKRLKQLAQAQKELKNG